MPLAFCFIPLLCLRAAESEISARRRIASSTSCAAARQGIWQVLPLGPLGYGNSPYSATSAFAGNPILISLERLADQGWIDRDAT